MVTLAQRYYILAWTSLWIYVPAVVWLIRFPSPLHPWYFLLLLLSGTFSILHWTENKTGDWRHRADLVVAIVLAISLTYHLLKTGRFLICGFLSGGLSLFFILQRLAQHAKDVNWAWVTFLHIIFRYLGFWLAMSVHLSDAWELHAYVGLWAFLTSIYILHIVWLLQRSKE